MPGRMSHTVSRRRWVSPLGLLLVLAQLSCETKPREVYEIPAGFRGWVEIRANRADCAPLRGSANVTVFTIPPNGILCTNSPIAAGLGREEFYYVKDASRVRLRDSAADPDSMIWNMEYYGSGGEGPEHERQRDRIRFFVGTKKEYEAARERGQ